MQAGDKKNYINARVPMWYALAFIEYIMYLLLTDGKSTA